MTLNFDRLRCTSGAAAFIAIVSAINVPLYHLPLLSFAATSLELSTFTAWLTLATVLVTLYLLTLVPLCLLALLSHHLLKPLCMLFALANAVAVYFVTSYHVVLDVTMMGNVVSTNVAESTEFLHPRLAAWVLLLGVLPCWALSRVGIRRSARLRIAVLALGGALAMLCWGLLASSSWPWIDANSKRLGGMILPWSYVINLGRYEAPRLLAPDAQILLPPATFASDDRTVVVLVIGESARAQNFSLYGYPRLTNPLLAREGVEVLQNASACATYTTASLRCILSHADAGSPWSKRFEPLTSYLQRNGVDVIWRSHNFGEPPMTVGTLEKADDLRRQCTGAGCDYDELLLAGLGRRIRDSAKPRVLVVLHQSGSHGPAYYSRYPREFEHFEPACKSVELGQCTHDELVNAYDNTILYEDYFLSRTIAMLRTLQDTSALMIYISDHGESLGEYGLYLHGIPYSMAPDVQKKIPFLVWMSDRFRRSRGVQAGQLESQVSHDQRDIFHTVMGAFAMHSDAYMSQYDIFSPEFASK